MNIARAALSFTLASAVAACGGTPASTVAPFDAGIGGSSSDAASVGPPPASDASAQPPPPFADGGVVADASAKGDGGSAGVPKNDATLVVTIPSTFAGTPRQLDVVVVASLPITTIPTTLYQQTNPTFTPGETLTLHCDDTGVTGSYYVVAVLYMEGGGQFLPANGTDYEGASPSPVAFAGASMNLGTLALELATADAGI